MGTEDAAVTCRWRSRVDSVAAGFGQFGHLRLNEHSRDTAWLVAADVSSLTRFASQNVRADSRLLLPDSPLYPRFTMVVCKCHCC